VEMRLRFAMPIQKRRNLLSALKPNGRPRGGQTLPPLYQDDAAQGCSIVWGALWWIPFDFIYMS
jgi:hypothetical protein